MKKRVFAMLLTAALCIGLLPTNVLAEGEEASEETKEEIAETAVQTAELTAEGENEKTAVIVEEEDAEEPSGDAGTVSEDAADAETAADWEATLPKDLTGNWAEDVVAVAQSQIGYTEDEEGYTRYGAWYGSETDDWDAMFVSFCLYYAEVPESEFPQASGADAWIRALKEAEQEDGTQLYADVSDYVPEPGDLIFLDTDKDGKADHVGIAEKTETDVDEDGAGESVQKVTVIEGDSNDAVEEKEYKSDGANITSEDTDEASVITGYGILPLQADAEEDEEAEDDAEDADIAELAWSESGKGKVVINLGNGNGKYNNADYTKDRQAGTLLRYTTDSLEEYADSDGKVTINLPADSNLNSTFTVVDATGSLSAVTIDLGSDLAYDYQLAGWVNIATGEYYDVSNGPVTATVDLNNDNVFYADWIAATYDHGSQTDANLRDDIVSTSGFVTMHMYDYNDLFNLYSESLVQNEDEDGTLWEAWTDSGSLYYDLTHTGTPATESFIFVNNGTVAYSGTQGAQSTGGMLTWPNNKTDGNTWTGTGKDPRNATEIWGITSPYSAPMNMLFDPESSALGVHYVGEADYLFWIDDNGYYTYNSKEAAATYNQTDQCFYVYDGVQNVTNTSFSCFLPYNTYGESLNAVNGTVNYFFGMDMEVNFYLPNATGTTGGNQVNGNDMVFNFSGDDDILIFVDDELVLDMSGIHDEAFGSINFSDGTVTMGMSTDANGNITDGTTTYFSLSSGTHDLKVYYMERGGYASNLEIQFNVVSLWEYESGEVQTVTAEKTWVDAQGNEINPEDLPDVYKENGVEVGLFDVLGPAAEDTYGYTRNGNAYTVVYTDDSGVTRTYVYDTSGPTLTYTEVDSDGNTIGPETDDQTDSEGRVLDKDGYVVAWLEGENLYIRIDKQTLNDANGWYYAWELLDPEASYEVLELSESSSYTTTSERENLLRYNYWSIIGDSQIEDSFDTGETLAVILTEAAQEADGTLGDTKDAMGWVIVASESGITTQQVEFSQITDLQKLEDDSSGQTSFKTIAGVTSQSEINRLGSGAIWYVVDAEGQITDASGSELEDFYLYCILDGTQYYLTLQESQESSGSYTLGVTTDFESASRFCYDSLGELLVVLSDESTVRVEIQADGTITIGAAEFEAELDDIRIYTLQETETSGFAFTATNTLLCEFQLNKVETGEEDTILEGATFSLYKDADCTEQIGFTVTEDENDSIIYTVSDDTEADNYTTTITAGSVTIAGIEGGTYYLKELTAPKNDYVHLNEVIVLTVTNESGSTIVTVEGAPNHVTTDRDTITVKNDARGNTQVPVEKVWDDEDDQDGIRPESITFHLFADGVEVASATVTAADGWAYTFTDLPLYESEDENDQDVEIVYTVTEDQIAGYDTTVDGYTVTNSHIPATTAVTVTKEWDDELVPQIRPDEISVQLYADGEAYGDAVTLTKADNWTYTWNDLPVNAAGTKIAYTVEEADVTGYTPTYSEITGDAENGYAVTITNTPNPEKLSIQKTVAGESDTTEYEFQITLESGDTAYNGDIEVTYSDGSTDTLTFEDGTAEVKITAGDTITLTLPYGMTWEVMELTEDADSTVIYVDNEIKDTASGTIEGDTAVRFVNSYRGYFPIDEEITPDDTDRSTWVKDESVNEYNAIEIEMSTLLPVITGYDLENGEFTMNFHEVLDHDLVLDEADADFSVYIAGNKIDHQYYTVTISPDDGCSFHVDVELTQLYLDGVITEDDLQGNTEIMIFFFADLEGTGLNGTYKSTVWYEVYDGEDLEYHSNEDVVYVYTYEIDITKYDASTLNGTDYDGSALAGATLGVYYDEACTDPVSRNNEPYTVTSDEDGKAIFYGLADGTYYVKEITAPAGYLLSDEVLIVVLGEELNEHGYAFEGEYANTPEPETRDISGSKTWDDDDDKVDARPASIKVNLYQNDELYESKTVTAADDWAWSWVDLPKYDEDGEAYAYTIDEDTVEYYTPTYYEGNFNITNTFVGEEGAEHPTSGPDKGGDTPKTGDTGNIGLWLALLAAALVCAVVGIRMRRKASRR